MTTPLNFQQVILKLHTFWASQGCAIWEPYNVQVGAGTGNPATLLRVLGPEPWRVAYVEPSVRPDDGRYGDNPNRMQKYYQYQVILKPDPGNPQELYLKSLEVLGIDPRKHDIRFVEDNWESPALGAWGLGWEVWLDGQEITQFTYFQQAGGLELKPVSVEITYGLERIVLALQGKESAWDIQWLDNLTYRDMVFNEEVEHCRYYFDVADVNALRRVYDTYEAEMARALEGDALISAYDYVLKCSHLFNVLDTRGAIGVTERAVYFRRMRDMTRNVAKAYAQKREALGYPLLHLNAQWGVSLPPAPTQAPPVATAPADFLLEVGVEELPADDVASVQAQLSAGFAQWLADLRLRHEGVHVFVTPRRIVLSAKRLAERQTDEAALVKGPPAERAFDANGNPTPAAIGFAKGKGLDVSALRVEEVDGGRYVVANVQTVGQASIAVLASALPSLLVSIKFAKSMRWNESGIAFSRPIRWLVALFGEHVIPFQYAGVNSGNTTRGLRPYGSPELVIKDAGEYFSAMASQNIYLSADDRRALILDQVTGLAEQVGGEAIADEGLLAEVVNLVEAPTAVMGKFEERYLALPREVLIMVMKSKQRYFALQDAEGNLMPYFITIRNGDREHTETVARGNEHVLRARFSDADYFYRQDLKKPLREHLERLATLTFQEKLGSMKDKNGRIEKLVAWVGQLLGADTESVLIADQAANILKADLGTQVVVEMTSLQGIMGRAYALHEGYPSEVAQAVYEHYLPRGAGDDLPESQAGIMLAITDRLDSLVGLFGAGLAPKSTADPFGLRRAALGVLQILLAKRISLDLAAAVQTVADVQPVSINDETRQQVLDFVKARLEGLLVDEMGLSRSVVAAVMAEQANNPYRAYLGAQDLERWQTAEGWDVLLDNFARCVRITRAEAQTYTVQPDLFEHSAERDLWQAYQDMAGVLTADANVGAFLEAFVSVVPKVQAFFDAVMVNAEQEDVRRNRYALLQAITALAKGRADFSLLSGF